MLKSRLLVGLLGLSIGSAAAADGAMIRVLTCKNEDAAMEFFMPVSAIKGQGIAGVHFAKPIVGAYALDLTDAGKGKVLESVRMSVTPDNKFVIIDQFTRKLPPTRVPIAGGIVSFDNRFGADAKCGSFNEE